MITSTTNERVKQVVKLHQRKYREESGLFLLEGKKAAEEAILAGFEIKDIFAMADYPDATMVSEPVMKKMSTTASPCEILAVAVQPKFELGVAASHKKVALIESIKDAGNLGTIIRAATAFGIESIILFGDTVDEFNPKTVRSAVGTLGKIPVVKESSLGQLRQVFPNHVFYATTLDDNACEPVAQDFKQPFVICFGSEADGLSKALIDACDKTFKLEMQNSTESLNLAVAAGIFFWEIHKSGRS